MFKRQERNNRRWKRPEIGINYVLTDGVSRATSFGRPQTSFGRSHVSSEGSRVPFGRPRETFGAPRVSAPFPPKGLKNHTSEPRQETPEERDEMNALLAMVLTPGLGPVRIRSLLDRNPSALFWVSQRDSKDPDAILNREFAKDDLSSFALQLLATARTMLVSGECDRIRQINEKQGFEMIGIHQSEYPAMLREIADAPPILWVIGEQRLLQTPSLAVVGTRDPTSYGIREANRFATRLSLMGWTLVSGLAKGIDGVVHTCAVQTSGATIAVLGSGLSHIYPPQHLSLAVQIIERGGLLVSEHPPETPPMRHHFPRRNRIVSGLSRGVIVIESGSTGGSMITAHVAVDQNRDAFAIPHTVDSLKGRGCNDLISRGEAKLVLDPEDVMQEFGIAGFIRIKSHESPG